MIINESLEISSHHCLDLDFMILNTIFYILHIYTHFFMLSINDKCHLIKIITPYSVNHVVEILSCRLHKMLTSRFTQIQDNLKH